MLRASFLKLKNWIYPEKDKEILDKENLDASFSNFVLHYTDPRKALLKDIDSIKKCKLLNTERSITWLFFLGIIPFKDSSTWNKIISSERENYSKLRTKYINKDIENFIELKRLNDTIKYDNYKTIINNEEFELLNLIKIDAQRTFQENEIFKLDIVKKKISNGIIYLCERK